MDNDVYTLFIREYIQKAYLPTGTVTTEYPAGTPEGTIDRSVKLSIAEFFNEFQPWFKEMYPEMKIPARIMVKYALEQRWGESPKGVWKGMKINRPEVIV